MGISLFSLFTQRVVLFQPRSFDKRHFISRPRSLLIKAFESITSLSASLRSGSRFRFRVVRRDVHALKKKARARYVSFSLEGNGNTPAQASESLAQCSNTVR